MVENTDKNSSEKSARNWDLLSMGSFVAAGVFGLVKAANDTRHQFYQSYVIGYDGEKTVFTDLLDKTKVKFTSLKQRFSEKEIDIKEFSSEMNRFANDRQTGVNTIMKERFNIPADNALLDWTVGSVQRSNLLGRTNRMNAAMAFAGTAAIAIGAVAVLKHSSRVLDSINQKLDQKKEDGRG